MLEPIYQINSFRDLKLLGSSNYFTFPQSALRYYGLKYIVAGLNSDADLYDRFYLNLNEGYVFLFEVVHTKIRQVIVSKNIPNNLKELLKEYNINFIFNEDVNFVYDLQA